MIVDAFESAGVAVDEIVACGGLPERNQLLMQIYADVTGPRVRASPPRRRRPRSARRCSARSPPGRRAGGYDSIVDASRRDGAPRARRVYRPDRRRHAVYDELYREYVRLHDLFGRGGDDVMRTLKAIQRRVGEAPPS